MDNFGKSQLLKYGWSEGKGLGKNENGMVQAIKPKLKFDTAGIGHTESNDYQWWKFVFNKAANNVDVIPQSCDISFKRKNESIEVHTKKKSSDGLKGNLLYGNFIKTCKLENGKLIQNKDSRSFIAPTNETQFNEDLFVLDDDVLFNACGGRTAHKGARHGIKQSGKLARIEKQEQELVDKILSLEVLDDDWIKVKKKKGKHRSRNMDTDNDDEAVKSQDETMQLSDSSEIIHHNDNEKSDHRVSRKTKKKNKRRVENLTHQLEAALDFSKVTETKKSKRKSNKNDSDVEVNRKKKKLKKNKSSDGDVEVCEENFILEVNNELSVDSNKSISSDVIESIVKKPKKKNILSACVLNNKIDKKKKQKFSKKEKRKMKFLSESLNELILDQNTQTFDKDNVIKKKKKKKKKKSTK